MNNRHDNAQITYGVHKTEIGPIILGMNDRAICWLGFMTSVEEGAYKGDALTRMKRHFPNADFIENNQMTKTQLDHVLKAWNSNQLKSINIDLHGTDFQKSVWQALLDIPHGKTLSYGNVAKKIGKAGASRAVGTAVGNNPISLIVPCHRVLNSNGDLGNYGWGLSTKKFLLQKEGIEF